MTAQDDREFLLGIFLMEAWDTAGALEEGLHALSTATSAEGVVPPLLVLAHRLRGSAALHGFPGVSELAAIAESRLESSAVADRAERARSVGELGELVALLKELFDGISATGMEDAERVAAFVGRRPAPAADSPSPSVAPEAPAPPHTGEDAEPRAHAEPSPSGHTRSSSPADGRDPIALEIDRFFADGGEILTYFVPEATEHLDVMTVSLLALERQGWSDEHLGSVFRAVHTLKGAAYTVGCRPIGDVAHDIEDLLAAVRDKSVAFGPAVVEAALAGADALRLVLQSAQGVPADLPAALARVTSGVRALSAGGVSAPPAEPAPVEIDVTEVEPAPALVPVAARRERREPERRAAGPGPGIRVSLDRLDSLMNLVGELMIARGRLDQHLAQLDRVGELLVFSRSRMSRAVREFEGKHSFTQLAAPRSAAGDGSGRPSAPRGDGVAPLAELFAELEFDRYDDYSILSRSLAEVSADVGEVQAQHVALMRAVRDDVAQVQRLTAALRKEVTRARMVPIGRLFPRVARQVREAARAAGKTVNLEVSGESVEVDNATVEQIADSLLHLVQNGISHGIEPPEERLARGKPAAGTLRLGAYQQGGLIVVEIEDDGRGMDAGVLKQQAVEQGVLRPEDKDGLSVSDALNLIFVPGFSTAASVTRAAGRGIGMDVVRTNVARLNGEVEVDTEVGLRTRFTLKLPLTVAIADALMVRAGSEVLALPLTSVGVMRLVDRARIETSGDREIVAMGGERVDLIRLGRVLGVGESEASTPLPVISLRSGGKPFALAVDELLGKEEIVIKSLDGLLEGVGPFAGATISGEGRVILLLDPARLLELGRTSGQGGVRERAPVASAAGDAGRRILLVDDSVSVRRFVGQMLEKAGFQVVTAVDGQDALERLTEITVDAVVTDLEMPRVNGYALIEDLRRRPATREVPIVVLTTRAGDKHRTLAHRLGVRHYVTKPVEEQAFVALMDSIVSPAERDLALIDAGSS